MKKIICIGYILSFLAGCSNSFPEGNLRKLTSRSTGLAEHEFIIGNRVNNAVSINYDIKLKATNEIYHCSATFAPISGGVTTMPTCEDNQGMEIKAQTTEVTF